MKKAAASKRSKKRGAKPSARRGSGSTADEMVGLLTRLGLQVIDGNKLVRRVGAGGQGVVFAYRTPAGAEVAYKFCINPLNDDDTKRFYAEAAALEELERHDRLNTIVRGRSPATKVPGLPIHYFQMELAPGRALSDMLMKEPPPWAWRTALLVVWRIAYALSPAHLIGLVHRDLHPGNLLFDDDAFRFDAREGECIAPGVKVLDFGVHRDTWAGMIRAVAEHNRTFRPIGAISHASPEAWRDPSAVEQQADVWALGVMLYRMLTGSPAFHAETFDGLRTKVLSGEYEPVPVPACAFRSIVIARSKPS